MMNIKICGLSNIKDAQYCYQHKPWALGFNFYSKSPRCISNATAKEIIKGLPKSILKVGIYINEPYDTLLQHIDDLGLDLVQVYAPLPDAPNSFKDKVILSLNAETTQDVPSVSVLSSYAYVLLDAPKMGHSDAFGGTGRRANWTIARTLANDYRVILAGGLNENNALEAMQTVNPYALDFASGLESAPGIKDRSKINRLFKEFRT
jgi:phosphoribosylanthranilate isomerase